MNLEKSHAEQGKSLSYCELNLETWRQLWRVLEISDIILIIADARYPVRCTRNNFSLRKLIFSVFPFAESHVSSIAIRIRNKNFGKTYDFSFK